MTDKKEQPVSMEPVAWGIVASNTGRICQVELDADEVAEHNPKYIVPLYTAAQMREYRNQALEEAIAKVHIAMLGADRQLTVRVLTALNALKGN